MCVADGRKLLLVFALQKQARSEEAQLTQKCAEPEKYSGNESAWRYAKNPVSVDIATPVNSMFVSRLWGCECLCMCKAAFQVGVATKLDERLGVVIEWLSGFSARNPPARTHCGKTWAAAYTC